MSLAVPPVTTSFTHAYGGLRHGFVPSKPQSQQTPSTQETLLVTNFEVKFDLSRQEIMFDGKSPCPIRNGDWIVVTTAGGFMIYS
jgi:hypothetical protein